LEARHKENTMAELLGCMAGPRGLRHCEWGGCGGCCGALLSLS